MVQGKRTNDMSNGATKYRDQQSTMSFSRKDIGGGSSKNDARSQNGTASSFRTDSAISGTKVAGERTLQRWVADVPEDLDGSLEGPGSKSSAPWDQFAENSRRFGLTTDYDENIYTTKIDKNHPQYKQRLADAEKKAREIERSMASNPHVAEERITDHVSTEDNRLDEEDKYSGVRRQDFPPLTSSSNKYTPPARRAPTAQSTVSGAPVDPAIISSQLARPERQTGEKTKPASAIPQIPGSEAAKADLAVPPASNEPSFTTPEPKPTSSNVSASASHAASPKTKAEGAPNATATVERDVASAFKGFAAQQRKNVDQIRRDKMRNDKEIKLNDLKKFADSFKLNTPVPSDLVSIIAKDPAKQKEIQEKAKRNAEEAKSSTTEAVKPVVPVPEVKPTQQRPQPAGHAASPSGPPGRHSNARAPYPHQSPYNARSSTQQSIPAQPRPGSLGARLRGIEQSKNLPQLPTIPIHDSRMPPTGPSHNVDPNFSRRSSGVASAQGGRLNPNSSEFRPSPFAASFNPSGNPSSASSPRSAVNAAENQSTPQVTRSLLRRKPLPESERPSIKGKFDALGFIKNIKPAEGKSWKATGDLKPAYDTPPTWRTPTSEDKADSTMNLTYVKLFEMAPFPTAMSPPMPSAVPPVPHQHQLPFHLQQGVHMSARQSPRQMPMNVHGGQHGHGPNPSFNGPDDHRMMPSHSSQSYASPRMPNATMAFNSPMNQSAQLAYNSPMMPYPGGPPMTPYRSLSQSQGFMPHQPHMGGPIMMQNGTGFMAAQGMPPNPQMMYPQGGQAHFMPPGNGHPPTMPVNGFPSPGRSAPMMMNQGSQQGHQQPMYGMSPGPHYSNVAPIYAQQGPNQMQMRGYPGGGPNQFGTSPQQMHQYGPQHRNTHPNGNYNKNYQHHNQHNTGPQNTQVPTGPQSRVPEGADEAK